MKRQKMVTLFMMILLTLCLSTISVFAMKRTDIDRYPAYPIFPIESTPIEVKSHDVNITIIDRFSASFNHTYVLKNSSHQNDVLKWMFPEHHHENLVVKSNNVALKYDVLPLTDSLITYEQIDYEGIINELNTNTELIEAKNQLVRVYKVSSGQNDLIINYPEDSAIIFNQFLNYTVKQNSYESHINLEKDLYIIDVYNNVNISLNNEVLQPIHTITFEQALKDSIHTIFNNDSVEDIILNDYYELLANRENIEHEVVILNQEAFTYTYSKVNLYELPFNANEEIILTVSYDIKPSQMMASEGYYYTYGLIVNKEYWHDYSDINVTINLDGEHGYTYIHNETIELTKSNDITYTGTIDIDDDHFYFGLYSSHKTPKKSNSRLAIIIVLAILWVALPYIIITIIIITVLIILIRRYIRKCKSKKIKK